VAPERERRAHLAHEASIRSISTLYFFNSFAGILATVALLSSLYFAIVHWRGGGESPLAWLSLGGIYVLLTALCFWTGIGLRRLDPRVKLAATLLTVMLLVCFPVGTLIGGYILWLLHSEKGQRIFAPDYPAIVAATPHIIYRTSWLAKGLILFLIAAGVSAVIILAR